MESYKHLPKDKRVEAVQKEVDEKERDVIEIAKKRSELQNNLQQLKNLLINHSSCCKGSNKLQCVTSEVLKQLEHLEQSGMESIDSVQASLKEEIVNLSEASTWRSEIGVPGQHDVSKDVVTTEKVLGIKRKRPVTPENAPASRMTPLTLDDLQINLRFPFFSGPTASNNEADQTIYTSARRNQNIFDSGSEPIEPVLIGNNDQPSKVGYMPPIGKDEEVYWESYEDPKKEIATDVDLHQAHRLLKQKRCEQQMDTQSEFINPSVGLREPVPDPSWEAYDPIPVTQCGKIQPPWAETLRVNIIQPPLLQQNLEVSRDGPIAWLSSSLHGFYPQSASLHAFNPDSISNLQSNRTGQYASPADVSVREQFLKPPKDPDLSAQEDLPGNTIFEEAYPDDTLSGLRTEMFEMYVRQAVSTDPCLESSLKAHDTAQSFANILQSERENDTNPLISVPATSWDTWGNQARSLEPQDSEEVNPLISVPAAPWDTWGNQASSQEPQDSEEVNPLISVPATSWDTWGNQANSQEPQDSEEVNPLISVPATSWDTWGNQASSQEPQDSEEVNPLISVPATSWDTWGNQANSQEPQDSEEVNPLISVPATSWDTWGNQASSQEPQDSEEDFGQISFNDLIDF